MTPVTPEVQALAFDYGERRIGVAAANSLTRTASALLTLPASDGAPDWAQLDALIKEWQPGILVIGLPYNIDGSESPMTGRARKFGGLLENRYGIPVEAVDERLTSREAASELREQRRSGVRSRRLRKGDIDSAAARLIAESWLNIRKRTN